MLQRSTEHVNFWQQAQPIWATATEQGLKISTYLWGRCDISWQDTKPIRLLLVIQLIAEQNLDFE
jgi:hypothetical protein